MAAASVRPVAPRPDRPAAALEARLRRLWFAPAGSSDALFAAALRPLSAVVAAVASSRRRRIAQAKAVSRPPGHPPVVVVGNLVVGGTGKTPLLIALAQALAARGWRPGVIARGHGGRAARDGPRRVGPDASAEAVGDEPLLVARRTGMPVFVGHDRGAALEALRRAGDCDVVLSDDGLQHVGLRRDIELAVFDGRGAGSGRCLPAGPLREPLRGALLLDALVLNGRGTVAPIVHSRIFGFDVVPTEFRSLDGDRRWTPAAFAAELRGATLDAVAGIGAPERFFDTLATIGVRARRHPLADHAAIDPEWLAALPGPVVVMTEKDAVKCSAFDDPLRARCVALRVEAVADAALVDWLEDRLRG